MIEEFRLPDLGEGLPEAELVQWLVGTGDTVALNQTIAEVETAKAVVELPSPFAGVVARLHAQAGDVVAVGSPLIGIETEARAGEAAPEEAVVPNLVGYGAAPTVSVRPQRRVRTFGGSVSGASASGASSSGAHAGGRGAPAALREAAVLEAAPHDARPAPEVADLAVERPRSTPPVRRLAKDLGVDLALVAAAGASGVITRVDVEAFAGRAGLVTAARPEERATDRPEPRHAERDADARVIRIPIRGVRRATAAAMVRSAFTAPQATIFLTVDVTATTELVAALKADRSFAGHRVGLLAIVAKAVCLSLRRHPMLNAAWDDDAGEIVQHRFVNLGIATATDRGLVVPNVKDADALPLVELADAIGALADAARAGRAPLDDLSGGTFTITNVGVFGVDAGTPILNPGEAGILALGAVRRMPWEHRGEIALRDVVALALTFDHRLVDGEQGARFLAEVGRVLREPGRAMLLT